MKISEIAHRPVIYQENGVRVSESIFRSWSILERVKTWLKRGVPGDVILELVEEIEEAGGLVEDNQDDIPF